MLEDLKQGEKQKSCPQEMNRPYISKTTHDYVPIQEELIEESPYRDPNTKVAEIGV